jgi:hypothetical protein
MCLPDIVSSTTVSVSWATLERELALSSMKGLSMKASVPTSQSKAFFNAPGYPRAYSGVDMTMPSAALISRTH